MVHPLLNYIRITFSLNKLHLHFTNFQSYTLEIPQIIFKSVVVFPTGSVFVLFLPLLCQSDLRSWSFYTYISEVVGISLFISYTYTYTRKFRSVGGRGVPFRRAPKLNYFSSWKQNYHIPHFFALGNDFRQLLSAPGKWGRPRRGSSSF